MALIRRSSPASDKTATSNDSQLSWEDKNAIVYDVHEQTLATLSKDDVPADCRAEPIPPRPKRTLSNLLSRKDSIQISVASGETQPFGFLANLKIDSLGREVEKERRKGGIKEIWLRGVPRSSLVELKSS